MARAYLKVYFDFEDRADELSDDEKGRLLLAMLRYARTGDKPELTGNERYCFSSFRQDIDRDNAAYESKVINGRNGGRPAERTLDESSNDANSNAENNLTKPNKKNENQTEPKETKDNLNLKNKNKNKNKKEEEEQEEEQEEERGGEAPLPPTRKRFTPPTLQEVEAYCRERANGINPQRFADFYAAKGWRIGKETMQDWKAAVRTWEQREEPPARRISQQQYTQRQHMEMDLDAELDQYMEAMKRGP